MSKTPPIPPEQRSYNMKADLASQKMDRRDQKTDAQSGQPGDADVNLKSQGRFGDIAQNVDTIRASTQDR
jgi:hypothetical protein